MCGIRPRRLCVNGAEEETEEREFGAFASVKDASPKYVMSLDRFDRSHDGITHINIEKWLKGEIDLHLA